MRPVVSPDEMRRADEAAIAAGTPVEVLMERAGRAVARTVLREAGGRYGRRVTVVCGKGNNGSDGFVAARVLHQEGLSVLCCTTSDPADSAGAAAHHLDLLRSSGCRVRPFEERYLRADVIVDAVFGTGFQGEPRGEASDVLRAIWEVTRGYDVVDEAEETVAAAPLWPRPRVVAVDVPSAGVVPANVTVALAAEKYETFFADAEDATLVEVADIGIPIDRARVYVVERDDVVHDLPRLDPDDHKTSHGSVAVIAGSDDTTGAALLTARGAARMGAGYVTLASTPHVIHAANFRLPEVLKKKLAGESVLGPAILDEAAPALERADAVAVGPGLGTGDAQTALVERCVRELEIPIVLDADALNALAGRGELLAEREWPCVITPHVGEMARLFAIEPQEVSSDRVGTALHAAETLGCVVVLKGRNTLVAAPSNGVTVPAGPTGSSVGPHPGPVTAWAVPVGGPELATAGTGDVLTGAIAASLARGGVPQDVAAMACYVHGVAGQIAAERSGPTGVVAWDVAEALHEAVDAIRGPYAD